LEDGRKPDTYYWNLPAQLIKQKQEPIDTG